MRTGTVYTFGDNHMRMMDTNVGPRGIANVSNESVNQDVTYAIKDKGIKSFLSNNELESTPMAFRSQLKESVVENNTDTVLLKKEKEAADYLFNTGTFSGYTSALGTNDRFSNKASDAFGIIQTAVNNIQKNGGAPKRDIKLIVGQEVYSALCVHPDLLARTPMTGVRSLNVPMLVEIFRDLGVNDILIGSQSYNNTDEGQTSSYGYIWGKYLLAAYIPPGANTNLSLTLAKQMVLSNSLNREAGKPINASGSLQVTTFKETDEENGLWYRVGTSYDFKVVCPSVGYLYSTAVS